MHIAWAMGCDGLSVHACWVALMPLKPISGIALGSVDHPCIPTGLGKNRGCSNRWYQVIPTHDTSGWPIKSGILITVDPIVQLNGPMIELRFKSYCSPSHREQTRLQDIELIDFFNTCARNAIRPCLRQDQRPQCIPVFLRKLFGIPQPINRTPCIQNNGRGKHRATKTRSTAPGSVRRTAIRPLGSGSIRSGRILG